MISPLLLVQLAHSKLVTWVSSITYTRPIILAYLYTRVYPGLRGDECLGPEARQTFCSEKPSQERIADTVVEPLAIHHVMEYCLNLPP